MAAVLGVFLHFFSLGCTSFGGPVAHLGYFHERFVQRERWLTEASYADLVALCQLLPGPSSSQVGIGLGMLRAGWLGGCAAWIGFTLPSALLMIAAAALLLGHPSWLSGGVIDGLKVASVAVVAQAVMAMQRKLAPDRERLTLMVFSALLVLLLPTAWGQLLALLVGGFVGFTLLRSPHEQSSLEQRLALPLSRPVAFALLAVLFGLLLSLPWLSSTTQPVLIQQLSALVRAGGLVFGGGHAVLPFLEQSVVHQGWLGLDQFLIGYGLAQAVPGPMFSFAAFLGFQLEGGLHGIDGAALALMALFLPAFLLIGGILPLWCALGQLRGMRRVLVGINAAVVGILLAALFEPLWLASIRTTAEFSLALVAFLLLACWRQPAWRVVGLSALVGAILFP
jgi:chromate transporter